MLHVLQLTLKIISNKHSFISLHFKYKRSQYFKLKPAHLAKACFNTLILKPATKWVYLFLDMYNTVIRYIQIYCRLYQMRISKCNFSEHTRRTIQNTAIYTDNGSKNKSCVIFYSQFVKQSINTHTCKLFLKTNYRRFRRSPDLSRLQQRLDTIKMCHSAKIMSEIFLQPPFCQ